MTRETRRFASILIILLLFCVYRLYEERIHFETPQGNTTSDALPETPASSNNEAAFSKSKSPPLSRTTKKGRKTPIPGILERCTVIRCIDGDTLLARTRQGEERIRLIGINTPETVKPETPVEPFGPEAHEYTMRRIREAKMIVYLKTDGDPFDKFDRRLALVYLDPEEKSLLNEELVREGLAHVFYHFNYSQPIKDRYQQAERLARSEKKGIWSLPPTKHQP